MGLGLMYSSFFFVIQIAYIYLFNVKVFIKYTFFVRSTRPLRFVFFRCVLFCGFVLFCFVCVEVVNFGESK